MTRDRVSASPEVERAEHCDREGRHEEAIRHLVAAANENDVEALTRLGKRLLIGDRAPCLPSQGADLLADASARGGAEAAAVLSVLYAVGASVRHDLGAGLDSLVLAAERRWAPAQAQLRVLAGSADRAAGAEERWQDIAEKIDLSSWLEAPSAIDLHDEPLVRSFPSFVSRDVCRWLIGRSRGRLSRAPVYEALLKKTTTHESRTNTAAFFNLLETDFVMTLIQRRMSACLDVPLRHFEPISVLHYGPDEEITEHFDFVDPNVPDYTRQIAVRGQRIVTFLVYLNADYAGGETVFARLGISHKGSEAEGLFFVNAHADGRSDLRTLHAGRPPLRGEKWIVSQFVRDRPTF